jgi:hypothetical protein
LNVVSKDEHGVDINQRVEISQGAEVHNVAGGGFSLHQVVSELGTTLGWKNMKRGIKLASTLG